MSNFPNLKTGAVLQYPAQREVRFATKVLRFLDGTEQRFRGYQAPLRRWTVRLDLLDQGELQLLREFFRTEAGAADNFVFVDPWDGTTYGNCSLQGADIVQQLLDEMNGKTSVTVRQNRG